MSVKFGYSENQPMRFIFSTNERERAITFGRNSGHGGDLPEGGEPGQILITNSEGQAVWGDNAAERLIHGRNISLDDDVTGTTFFDGSTDVVIHAAVNTLTIQEIDELLDSAPYATWNMPGITVVDGRIDIDTGSMA